jgi:hypothetical protein
MCAAEATGIPWGIVISGAVGVVGIAGTLLSGHFANRAAEKRRLAEQQHDDRTRFHKERVEVYARYIGAIKTYMDAVAEKRWPGRHLLEDFLSTPHQIPSPSAAREACAEICEALVLIAAKEVAQAASRAFSAVIALENNESADTNYQDWDRPAIVALTDFRKAARAEILPADLVDPK